MELRNFLYLLINFLIIIGPLILSFERKIFFWGKIKYIVASILLSNVIFITWDVIATYYGHWSFAEDSISGFQIGNLPIEEILFFFTANFATLFLYEVFVVKFKPTLKEVSEVIVHKVHIFLLFLFSVFLLLFGFHGYTSIAISLTIVFLLFEVMFPFYARIKKFIIYLILVFIVFFIFNSLLTGIPIVLYDPFAIIGFRFGSVPIEDLFFNYLMVLTTLRIYLLLQFRKL